MSTFKFLEVRAKTSAFLKCNSSEYDDNGEEATNSAASIREVVLSGALAGFLLFCFVFG